MQVTFNANQESATVDITITPDIIFEADEQFRVELFNPDTAETLGDVNKAIVTIYDDDSEASKFALKLFILSNPEFVVRSYSALCYVSLLL